MEHWLAQVPAGFRFCPKAQRGATLRAFRGDAAHATEAFAWLAEALSVFGDHLGVVLLSAPARLRRDDGALAGLLAARPAALPLALELPHASWSDDAVHALLADHQVALVATDRDSDDEPDLRRLGHVMYLRLRRTSYDDADIARWADRLAPFLADGLDAYVFFRHDADGVSALHAEALHRRLEGVIER